MSGTDANRRKGQHKIPEKHQTSWQSWKLDERYYDTDAAGSERETNRRADTHLLPG